MTIPQHITAAIRSGKFTYCGEAQLSNFGETARKGQYVEFFLDDGPDGNSGNPFKGLSTGREKGQRFGLIAVPLGDDDAVAAPEPPRERKPAATRAEKARRLCGVEQFQAWMGCSNYHDTSSAVKNRCGVTSKNMFDTGLLARQRWDTLLAEYEQQTGRMAERH